MRLVRWITLLWPGLTDLWLFGGWWGLAIACSFAWLANLAIVSTILWTDWIGAWSRAGVWVLLAVSWTASIVLSFRQLRGSQAALAQGDAEDLFRRAQREYLHGNWVQAEQLLSQLTSLNAGDAVRQANVDKFAATHRPVSGSRGPVTTIRSQRRSNPVARRHRPGTDVLRGTIKQPSTRNWDE